MRLCEKNTDKALSDIVKHEFPPSSMKTSPIRIGLVSFFLWKVGRYVTNPYEAYFLPFLTDFLHF